MTDDIVTRLRKAVAQTAEADTLPSWDFAKVVWEAADEIECLWRELEKHGGLLSFSGYRGARADETSQGR